jgi:hypothetical protein
MTKKSIQDAIDAGLNQGFQEVASANAANEELDRIIEKARMKVFNAAAAVEEVLADMKKEIPELTFEVELDLAFRQAHAFTNVPYSGYNGEDKTIGISISEQGIFAWGDYEREWLDVGISQPDSMEKVAEFVGRYAGKAKAEGSFKP